MSFKCSLLGHDFGSEDTRVVTEETDDSDLEVVQNIRECSRCGHEKVVSENKQVRAKQPSPEPSEPTETPASGVVADGGNAGLDDAYDSSVEDDAIIIDNDLTADPDDEPSPEAEAEAEPEAETEGEILTDDLPEDDAAASTDDAGAGVASGDEGVHFIGNSSPSSTTEDSEDTGAASENSSAGVSGKAGVGGAAVRDGMGDAVIVDSDPSPTAEPQASPDTEAADSEASAEAGAEIISDSPGATAVTEDSESEVLTETEPEETARPHEREDIPGIGVDMQAAGDERYLFCGECGYREARSNECRWAGDACPECRSAFLAWEDEQ